MKKEDWTSRLRNRLADYEESAPDGLWEQIESKLPETNRKQRKPVVIWRYIAAAAILLFAIVGTRLLWNDNESTVTPKVHIANNDDITKGQQSNNLIANNNVTTQPEHGRKKTYLTVKEENGVEVATVTNDNATEKEPVQEKNKEVDAVNNRRTAPDYNIKQTSVVDRKKAKSDSRLTASLYANNIISPSSMSSNGVIASSNMIYATSGTYLAKKNTLYLSDYKEEAEHKLPVSIGLSISYSLTDRLWIESGAVYTRLSSTFTHKIASRSISDEQVLQYIGIPLRAGYTVWKDKRFGVYAIAGGEADFNVKAELETEGVTREIAKDRTQWSVSASAGVQYNMLPQLGIYAEPGIRYYFDNGSGIDNIFKDKKLDFSIQLGLRLLLDR